MQKGFALIIVLLLATAWQNRKNSPVLFVMIATLFGVAAFIVASRPDWPEWILKLFAVSWLVCMLLAGVFAGLRLFYPSRKKTKLS